MLPSAGLNRKAAEYRNSLRWERRRAITGAGKG